ncbi:MAG: nucleotide exchange factor GrpE [Kiritimatiellaceae bacterium]|nr:nucleotide exchange factor GrpE [Kiritimatiellaceae bacterium]
MSEEKNENVEAGEEAREEEVLPDTEVIEEASAVEEESLRDQFVRLQADFANFRNRTQRERVELYQRANEDLLLELLPVLDHFELGLETARKQEADAAVLEGFSLVLDQFTSLLERFKVTPIEAVGAVFDPHVHEALTHMPSEEVAEGVCMNEVRKGYRMGEKLLRAAQVVVSSGATVEGGE